MKEIQMWGWSWEYLTPDAIWTLAKRNGSPICEFIDDNIEGLQKHNMEWIKNEVYVGKYIRVLFTKIKWS